MKLAGSRAGTLMALGLGLAAMLVPAGPADGRAGRAAGRVIGRPGEEIDPARHAVRGKVTIVDFYSAGCHVCQELAPHLERLERARTDIAVLTVDVNRPGVRGIDFRSPVVRQHGIQALPHIQIYDREGRRRLEGEEAYRLVAAWIEALAPGPEEPRPDTRRPPPDADTDRAGS